MPRIFISKHGEWVIHPTGFKIKFSQVRSFIIPHLEALKNFELCVFSAGGNWCWFPCLQSLYIFFCFVTKFSFTVMKSVRLNWPVNSFFSLWVATAQFTALVLLAFGMIWTEKKHWHHLLPSSHFKDEKRESQKGGIVYLKAHSQLQCLSLILIFLIESSVSCTESDYPFT